MKIYLFVHLYLVSAVGHTDRQTVCTGGWADRRTNRQTERQTEAEAPAVAVAKCIKNMLKAKRNLCSFAYLSELRGKARKRQQQR